MSVIKKEITLEQFSSVCRTCLDTDDLQPLAGTKFVDMIKDISKLESAIEELLPPNICEQCIRKLEDLNAFINLSQQTYRILKDALEEKNSHIEFVRVDGAPENGIAPETMEVVPETIEVAPEIIEVSPEIQGVTECQEMAISDIKSESPSDFEDTDEEEDLVHSNDDEDFPQSSDTEPKKPAPAKKTNTTKPNWQSTHCKVCDTTFNSKKKYNIHLKENPTCKAQKYKCHVCGKIWKSGFRLQHHMRSHTGENPYKCQVCEKGFRYTTNLKRHVENVHMGLKPFVCEICGKAYSRAISKNDHMSKHMGKEPYECSYCKSKFHYNGGYRMHLFLHRLYRGEVNNTPLKVTECDDDATITLIECIKCAKIVTENTVAQHYHYRDDVKKENDDGTTSSTTAAEGNKDFLCTVCGRLFLRKVQLQQHLLIHSDSKPFPCNQCDKRFRHHSTLRTHLLWHTGERPFTCLVCNYKFTQRQHLKEHMRRHTGEKPYKCEYCGKGFASKTNYVVHNRLHTGITPYKCPICQRKFCDNTSLKKHIKTHERDLLKLQKAQGITTTSTTTKMSE